MPQKSQSDISDQKGLIARLPNAIRPYAVLMRLDRPVGWWLLLLPGWWAIALASGGAFALNQDDLTLFLLFFVGAVIMRAAGCIINDLWDRDLDRQVARTAGRPLAAGAITPRQALFVLCGLLASGALILFQLSLVAILLGFLALPLIALYPLMKRWTWWPQIFLGLTFNFSALIGWAAVSGVVELPALLLYAGGIFWTIGYDTIYAHQDADDDALIGIKSSALKLGEKSPRWIAGFYALAFLMIAGAFTAGGAGWLSLAALVLPAAHLFLQIKRLDTNDPAICLLLFKSNRDAGLLFLLAALL